MKANMVLILIWVIMMICNDDNGNDNDNNDSFLKRMSVIIWLKILA